MALLKITNPIEFIAAIRDNHPGTSLCSGVEAVGLVAGVITIYSASRDAYDKITRKLDENEIEYTDMTDDVIEADNNDT